MTYDLDPEYFVKAQRHNHTVEDMVFSPIFISKVKIGLEIAKSEGFVAKGRRADDASQAQTEEEALCDKLRAPLEPGN